MADDFAFGIEEEYFLVRPQSRRLIRKVPKAFLRTCRARFGDRVHQELLQSQIEVASPVFHTPAEARAGMAELRTGLADIAESVGRLLMAAGTHPLASWQGQRSSRAQRYTKLIKDFQIIGRRNLICGMHVHVAVPGPMDRIQVMNRLLPWLPHFLALSTSSPFWNRQPTGLLSYRQSAQDEWPRGGVPDHLADEGQYRDFVRLMVRQGAITDGRSLWWTIRPAEHHPTIELRITDVCPHLDDALALATLFRCLVRAHVRRPSLGANYGPLTRRVIEENRWRAKRYGIEAEFINEHGDEPLGFAASLGRMRDLIAEDAEALDSAADIAHLDTILARGTSAHEQLGLFTARRAAGASRLDALIAVVDQVVAATTSVER